MTVALTQPLGKEKMLEAAIIIGDELLDRAEVSPQGITWSIAHPADGRGLTWRQAENIFSGVSGIALFLTELHRHTQNYAYLEAALGAMRWVSDHCRKNPTESYGFYSGRLGVSYVLLQLHMVTRDPQLLEKALDLARPAIAGYLPNKHTTNCLFEGRAGALLVLLHLYQASQAPWLLGHLAAFVDKLLEEAKYDKVGIYWDRSCNSVKGLCSFAHGTAGIGYVFAELGRYFGNAAFHAVARQAFAYENHHWCPEEQNWPDYRKDITGPDTQLRYETAYLNNDLGAFDGAFTDTSWAHGTAGIGMARLQSVGLAEYGAYHADLGKAARTVAQRRQWLAVQTLSPAQQSLYGGLAGEGAFFLEAYRVTAHAPYLRYAQAAAEDLQAQEGGARGPQTDFGLLSGRAGLGYFYLQLAFAAAGDSADSIALPGLPRNSNPPATAFGPGDFSGPSVRKKLLAGSFPRTVELLAAVAPETLDQYCGDESDERPAAFLESARQGAAQLPDPAQESLLYVLALESLRYEMTCSVNNACLHMQERFAQDEVNRMLDLDEEALGRLSFKLSDSAVIVRTRQDELLLRNAGTRLTEATQGEFMLMYGTKALVLWPSGRYNVEDYDLGLELLVLEKMTEPITLREACEEIIRFFLPNTELFIDRMAYFCRIETGDKLLEQFEQLLRQLIKKYICVGVLVPAAVRAGE